MAQKRGKKRSITKKTKIKAVSLKKMLLVGAMRNIINRKGATGCVRVLDRVLKIKLKSKKKAKKRQKSRFRLI
ncbi:MAG: hypothetical protein BWK75_06045 [Candidatus Altiarchaeales archaeon A3]|nr:MAG: hypothetical protein BWK75_06045 [Candidatus Altiarchaeales archaeon A3]